VTEPWPLDPRAFFLDALPTRLRAHAARLGAPRSTGCLGVCIDAPAAAFGLRLVEGEVVVVEGVPRDAIARVRTTTATFRMLIERVAPVLAALVAASASPGLVARLVALEERRGAALRELGGLIAVVATDGATEHRVEVVPGATDPAPPLRSCTLRLVLADLIELIAGRLAPIQLVMSGQLVVEGDAELMMALVGTLG